MRALLLEQQDHNTLARVTDLHPSQLPEGNVIVDINWSSLNYKDALAITGKGKIVKQFPMVPGIDFSGQVHSSQDPRFKAGQSVLLTGWGVGEHHWGGLAEQARVSGDWLLPLPTGLSERNAMILGTAGLTAMLCVMALEEGGMKPEQGNILVTGASGGVGSTAIALLSALGYRVAALTGRPGNTAYLMALGATAVLARNEYLEMPRPLEKQRWAGAIDTLGATVLARVLAEMNYNSTLAVCGLAAGYALSTTVMPFILRNVRLQGIDSVHCPMLRRQSAWERLAKILPDSFYQQATQEISLDAVPVAAAALINNRVTGRTLVKVR